MANIVTGIRIGLCVAMLFFSALSPVFLVLYILAGVSDMIDGVIARETGKESLFGKRFDAAADFIFIVVSIIKFLPVVNIPGGIWLWTALIFCIKLYSIAYGYAVKKKIIIRSTGLNKLTGLLLFILPMTLSFVPIRYSATLVCIVATFAALQEGPYRKFARKKFKSKKKTRWFFRIVAAIILIVPSVLLTISTTVEHRKRVENPYRANVSDKVKKYETLVKLYCNKNEIPEYKELALAMIQQESSGNPPDVMQAEESPYNLEPPIDSADESIRAGCHELADCLRLAKCKGPTDIKNISVAIQGYNYGKGYISWTMKKYNGYTPESADVFSSIMMEKLNWPRYGDTMYVPHVLRYYVKKGKKDGKE